MKKKFEDWMIRNERKSTNTAYQYANSIDKISKHYSEANDDSIDIYLLKDPEKVRLISNDYSQSGKYSTFGEKGNGTIRNAIATYCRYIEHPDFNQESDNQVEIQSNEKTDEITNFAYERDLKNALISELSNLFPGYKIFGSRSEGIEYPIEGKYIDVLLEHEQNSRLKAIELKAGVADFKAFGQLSMYLGLLKSKFPERDIQGVIIAGAIDDSLKYACLTNSQVELRTYQMKLLLENA